MNARMEGTPLTLQEVLTVAADEGHPHLAQEAQSCLEAGNFKIGKASEDEPPEGPGDVMPPNYARPPTLLQALIQGLSLPVPEEATKA